MRSNQITSPQINIDPNYDEKINIISSLDIKGENNELYNKDIKELRKMYNDKIERPSILHQESYPEYKIFDNSRLSKLLLREKRAIEREKLLDEREKLLELRENELKSMEIHLKSRSRINSPQISVRSPNYENLKTPNSSYHDQFLFTNNIPYHLRNQYENLQNPNSLTNNQPLNVQNLQNIRNYQNYDDDEIYDEEEEVNKAIRESEEDALNLLDNHDKRTNGISQKDNNEIEGLKELKKSKYNYLSNRPVEATDEIIDMFMEVFSSCDKSRIKILLNDSNINIKVIQWLNGLKYNGTSLKQMLLGSSNDMVKLLECR